MLKKLHPLHIPMVIGGFMFGIYGGHGNWLMACVWLAVAVTAGVIRHYTKEDCDA